MSDFGDALRRDFQGKRTGSTRGAKLARVLAKPEQVEREGGSIVINPPGEDALARAEREAKEARKLADEAKKRAG
jgi:hypothetical protein